VQLFRGSGELAGFSDGDKAAQLVKLHRLLPFHPLWAPYYVTFPRCIKRLPEYKHNRWRPSKDTIGFHQVQRISCYGALQHKRFTGFASSRMSWNGDLYE
jgi:hypothetical protein